MYTTIQDTNLKQDVEIEHIANERLNGITKPVAMSIEQYTTQN